MHYHNSSDFSVALTQEWPHAWTWPLHTCPYGEEISRQFDKRVFNASESHIRHLAVFCATVRFPLSDAVYYHADVGKLLPREVNRHMAKPSLVRINIGGALQYL